MIILDLPQVPSAESLVAEIDGGTALLSWETPSGSYDYIKIQACQLDSSNCMLHNVLNPDDVTTTIEITEGMGYEFILILYQEGYKAFVEVAKSETFHIKNIGQSQNTGNKNLQ